MLRILRSGNKRTKLILWAVAVVTIVSFVGGFIFLFGARLDPGQRSRSSNDVGQVNGDPISIAEYQSAVNEQRANYRRQFGTDPADRDQKMLEVQAWRSLVAQRLLADQARALGLKPHDREVVIALTTSPPQQVTNLPVFQTNGKFDVEKYKAALRDPNQSWAGVEDLVRDQLPVRKFQERMMASINRRRKLVASDATSRPTKIIPIRLNRNLIPTKTTMKASRIPSDTDVDPMASCSS